MYDIRINWGLLALIAFVIALVGAGVKLAEWMDSEFEAHGQRYEQALRLAQGARIEEIQR